MKIKKIQRKRDKIINKTDNKILEVNYKIEEFFKERIKDLSNNLGKEVSIKIQEDFFKNNKEEIEESIYNKVSYFLKEDKLKELERELIDNIDFNIIISKIKEEIRDNIEDKMDGFMIYKQEILENPPTCKGCGSNLILKNGQYGLWWSCPNYKICSQKNNHAIPPLIKRLFKEDD